MYSTIKVDDIKAFLAQSTNFILCIAEYIQPQVLVSKTIETKIEEWRRQGELELEGKSG